MNVRGLHFLDIPELHSKIKMYSNYDAAISAQHCYVSIYV